MLLYTRHSRALSLLFSDLEGHALMQEEALLGTAGAVVERRNASGFRFYVHQHYDAEGKRREVYLAGPAGEAEAEARAEALRGRIREVKELVPSLRLLGREGFNLLDPKTYAVVAALHNAGVFAAGASLVGSHAYGVLLNRLGVRATPYATEDIDLARAAPLTFTSAPERRLREILSSSGIEFVEVPQLDRKAPPTSFKQRGRSRFHVDLLVPARDDSYPIRPVPELGAHATGLPFLDYLLAESQTAMAMAREGCCAVRVPLPERFALHKLVISQLRAGRSAKSGNDVRQACVLAAALAETHPGAVDAALARLSRRGRKLLRAALPAARLLLGDHPRAWEELGGGRQLSRRASPG